MAARAQGPRRGAGGRYASPVTVACALLVPLRHHPPGVREAARAALRSGADESLAVVGSPPAAEAVPEEMTVLLDGATAPDEASAARVAVDWAARSGHAALVVGYGELGQFPCVGRGEAWAALVGAPGVAPVVVGTRRAQPAGLVRLEATSWSLLPLSGGLEVLWRARPELAGELDLTALVG